MAGEASQAHDLGEHAEARVLVGARERGEGELPRGLVELPLAGRSLDRADDLRARR